MVTIVDYGLGDLGSIKNMINKVGGHATVASGSGDILNAEMLILPGVGAFDSGMLHLKSSGLLEVLNERVLEDKIPVLGICLGAQLMTSCSDEGVEKGLGWFDATTTKMDFTDLAGRWPLPNIGWRNVVPQRGYSMLEGIEGLPRFYFVHSYCMRANRSDIVSLTTSYGFEFACGLRRDNIHCVQFHPEKSHIFGMQFFRNFLREYQ